MPELSVGQAGKELTHNQALAILDQIAQAVVVDKDLTAPPVSPANGAMYIPAPGATGPWAGQSGKLAFWLTTVAAWTFVTPANGWSVWVADEAARYERIAGVWQVGAGGFSFNRGNILGPVSQSAGTPTGAIIERGSNANGEYVRYADGTQICTQSITAGATTTAFGALFRSISLSWSFPAAFVNIPTVSGIESAGNGFCWASLGATSTSTVGTTVMLLSAISAVNNSTVSVSAIGRWF